MKLLIEKDEAEDFIELHLSEKELRHLIEDEALAKDYPSALQNKRNLNICIRKVPYALK